MGYPDHKSQSGQRTVACAVITCSDTRTHADDESGLLIRTLLEAHGHTHPFCAISKDDPGQIRDLLAQLAAREDIQAVILNGGTGISRRDHTYDAVAACLTRILPGFGELFRMLSYQTIGSGALLSRAVAGILVVPPRENDPGGPRAAAGAVSAAGPQTAREARHIVVFSIPGSPDAVELAMTKLILPELSHLVWETLR
jgi:molybdopterin adenylyltransferase